MPLHMWAHRETFVAHRMLLLFRILELESGSVLIDGRDIAQVPLETLRRAIVRACTRDLAAAPSRPTHLATDDCTGDASPRSVAL